MNSTNLDAVTERLCSDSCRSDDNDAVFGRRDLLPFWVADMNFESPAPILRASGKELNIRFSATSAEVTSTLAR